MKHNRPPPALAVELPELEEAISQVLKHYAPLLNLGPEDDQGEMIADIADSVWIRLGRRDWDPFREGL